MEPQSPIRVVIVDREAMFRDALRRVINAEHGLLVVGEAPDGARAVELLRRQQPQVTLLELTDDDGSLDVLRNMLAAVNHARVIGLAAEVTMGLTVKAVEIGAYGVVDKGSDTSVLCESIRSVAQGHHWLGDGQVSDVMHAIREHARQPAPDVPASRYGLTPRELEIVLCVTEGYSNKDIAARCRVREDTVKHHLSSIFAKVRVRSRLELAMFAVQNGVVSSDDQVS